jgi:hypothetical protein
LLSFARHQHPVRRNRTAAIILSTMTVFLWLAIIMLGLPVARALAVRIAAHRDTDPMLAERLRKHLEIAESRAEEGERRIAQLEEKVDFLERLLRDPKSAGRLPPPSSP